MKIGKFCTGLAVINDELPANKWHRTMRHNWLRHDPDPQQPDQNNDTAA